MINEAAILFDEGSELNQLNASTERGRLLFSQVQNRVVKVNPHFPKLPLKLEQGKSCSLGLFADSELKNGISMEVWEGHGRSALLGRVAFADDEDNIYRDIDLKGAGYIKFSADGRAIVGRPGIFGADDWGLTNLDEALRDYEIHEEFVTAGIRTDRIIGVIGLEEIVVNGIKMPCQQAIDELILREGFKPSLEVRAFVTKARVQDLVSRNNRAPLFLEDAKKIAARELGKDETIPDEDYVFWFAGNLGVNIGKMHKKGWVHTNLSDQNITVDCRIVDLDTVENIYDGDEKKVNDFKNGQRSIRNLLSHIGQIRIREDEHSPSLVTSLAAFEKRFIEAYELAAK